MLSNHNPNVSLLPDNPSAQIMPVQGGGGSGLWHSSPITVENGTYQLALNHGFLKKFKTRWRQTLGPNIPSRRKPRQDPHIIVGSLNAYENPVYLVAPLRGDSDAATRIFSWSDNLLISEPNSHIVFMGPIVSEKENSSIESAMSALLSKYPGHIIFVSDKETTLPSLDGLLLEAVPHTSKQIALGFIPHHENVYNRSSRSLNKLVVETLRVPYSKKDSEETLGSLYYLKFQAPTTIKGRDRDNDEHDITKDMSLKVIPGWVTKITHGVKMSGGAPSVKESLVDKPINKKVEEVKETKEADTKELEEADTKEAKEADTKEAEEAKEAKEANTKEPEEPKNEVKPDDTKKAQEPNNEVKTANKNEVKPDDTKKAEEPNNEVKPANTKEPEEPKNEIKTDNKNEVKSVNKNEVKSEDTKDQVKPVDKNEVKSEDTKDQVKPAELKTQAPTFTGPTVTVTLGPDVYTIRNPSDASVINDWSEGKFEGDEMRLLDNEGLRYNNDIYSKFLQGLVNEQCSTEPDVQMRPECGIFRYIMANRYFNQVRFKNGRKPFSRGDVPVTSQATITEPVTSQATTEKPVEEVKHVGFSNTSTVRTENETGVHNSKVNTAKENGDTRGKVKTISGGGKSNRNSTMKLRLFY